MGGGDGNHGVNAKYVYVHDQESSPSRALDSHHVEVRRSGAKALAACLFAALVAANAFYVFLAKLETHYRSGRVDRRFVPVGKILKPVLQECVTPVTCYWCLSLVLREEEQLMLVFKELRPPLKMLIPIWKALCAAINERSGSEGSRPNG